MSDSIQRRINHLKDRIADLETWLAEGEPYAPAIHYQSMALCAAVESLCSEVNQVFSKSADDVRASEWPLEEEGESND